MGSTEEPQSSGNQAGDRLLLPRFPTAHSGAERTDVERALKMLRAELDATDDRAEKASLSQQIAQVHELRGDLGAAARDALGATNLAAGFVEPLEALIGIAIRSRSASNLKKLLGRLGKVVRTAAEHERAALALAVLSIEESNYTEAASALDAALDQAPESASLWLAREAVAAAQSDFPARARAITGRMAHVQGAELRALLFERSARLLSESGEREAGLALYRAAVDEHPRWALVSELEATAVHAGAFDEAAAAARVLAALADQDASNFPEWLTKPAAKLALQLRRALHLFRAGDDEGADLILREAIGEKQDAEKQTSSLPLLLLVASERRKGVDTTLLSALELAGVVHPELLAIASLIARRLGDVERAEQLRLDLTRPGHPSANAEPPEAASDAGKSGQLPGRSAQFLGSGLELLAALDDSDRSRLAKALVAAAPWMKSDASQSALLCAGLLFVSAGSPNEALAALTQSEAHGLPREWALGMALGLATANNQTQGELEAIKALVALGAVSPDNDEHDASGDDARSESDVSESANLQQKMVSDSDRESLRWLLCRLAWLAEDGDSLTASLSHAGAGDNRAVPELPHEGSIQESLARLALLSDKAAFASLRHLTPTFTRALLLNALSDPSTSGSRAKAQEALAVLAEDAPNDLLLGALRLGLRESHAKTPARGQAPQSDARSINAATHALLSAIHEPRLEAALRLRAALAHLASSVSAPSEPNDAAGDDVAARTRRTSSVQAALAVLAPVAEHPEIAPLLPWLASVPGIVSSQTPGSPRGAKSGQKADPAAQLRQAFELLKNDSLSALALLDEPGSPAAALLKLLVALSESPEALEDATVGSSALDDPTRGALLFSAGVLSQNLTSQFSAARRWAELSPGVASLLAFCVSARMLGQSGDEARGRTAIAEYLGSPEFEAGSRLLTGARLTDADSFSDFIELAEGAAPTVQARIAWDVAEAAGPLQPSEARGQALLFLANKLEGDPDALAARLQAAYCTLHAGDAANATSQFESLFLELPDDVSVLLGLKEAARVSSNPGAEAHACTELARRSDDHLEAAQLWERAGVLYQDHLGKLKEAESAFSAALGRSPGSQLSFARLYRLSHAAGDRARLVELIDARLDVVGVAAQMLELLWEKARYCHALGRRAAALRSLSEILKLDAQHLPALALSAELHLVDQRLDAAAEALRAVALHPSTPENERTRAGLHASDLLERLHRPREAVALLAELGTLGVSEADLLERRARTAARSAEWDTASTAFLELAELRDAIDARLEAAKMVLAIQRDHLKDPEALAAAARLVLRDAPADEDAVDVVLSGDFTQDERKRLLAPARDATLTRLKGAPVDLLLIQRLVDLTENTDLPELERVSLGTLALTGRLNPDRQARLLGLTSAARTNPTAPLSRADREGIASPTILGSFARIAELLVPAIVDAALPSKEALGLTPLMRVDPFNESQARADSTLWMSAVGIEDHELYVGGAEPNSVIVLSYELPTVIIGKAVDIPVRGQQRVRLGYLCYAEAMGVSGLLSLSLEESQAWLRAGAQLAESSADASGDVAEKARALAAKLDAAALAELADLVKDISKAGHALVELALGAVESAAKMAALVHGDPSVLRTVRELLPESEADKQQVVQEVVRFCLSPDFLPLRRKLGLDLS